MKKIAIIGKLPDKYCAPFDNLEWEIWGCNVHPDFLKLKRFDKWFDIHIHPAVYEFMPDSKLVLRDEDFIQKMVNLYGGEFFTNSMNYMLSYAFIVHGADEVCFYGCSLNDDYEIRTKQKESLNMLRMFWLGRGKKINSYDPYLFYEYERYLK